jgi:hypothetical protein
VAGGRRGKRSARKTALGRRPAKERQEKKERSSPLSLSRDDATGCGLRGGDAVSTRGEKEPDESEEGEIEEEGFVAERGFQRSQLLDASRAAGGTTGYRVSSRCIDVREFREFRFPRHSRA